MSFYTKRESFQKFQTNCVLSQIRMEIVESVVDVVAAAVVVVVLNKLIIFLSKIKNIGVIV